MKRQSPLTALLIGLLTVSAVPARVNAQTEQPSADAAIAADSTGGARGSSDTLHVVAPPLEVKLSHGVPLTKNPTWAALRSAVIPGWGQAYTGNWIKAVVFFGVDSGFAYGALIQNRRYLDSLSNSRNTKTETERKRLEAAANFYRDDRNRLFWYVAGITLLSSLDAYVEAHLYDFRIDPTLQTPPSGEGVQAGLKITFSL